MRPAACAQRVIFKLFGPLQGKHIVPPLVLVLCSLKWVLTSSLVNLPLEFSDFCLTRFKVFSLNEVLVHTCGFPRPISPLQNTHIFITVWPGAGKVVSTSTYLSSKWLVSWQSLALDKQHTEHWQGSFLPCLVTGPGAVSSLYFTFGRLIFAHGFWVEKIYITICHLYITSVS